MGRASKDKRDVYYRKAKEEGYRARSAYKLLQLHEEFDILRRDKIVTGVVDLCAAPGSWSQVLSHHLRGPPHDRGAESDETNVFTSCGSTQAPRIVAVDLQEMMPIDGVQLLQGDITSEWTAREIIRLLNGEPVDATTSQGRIECDSNSIDVAADEEAEGRFTSQKSDLEGAKCNRMAVDAQDRNTSTTTQSPAERKADLVVCDGAPDVTGMHELDEYLQHHLLLAALNITTFVLRRGGTFVTKMFRGPNTPFLVAKAEVFFRHVTIAKPKSSRNASMEAFMVCQDYDPPADYRPSFERPLTQTTSCFTPSAPSVPSSGSHQQCFVANSSLGQQEVGMGDANGALGGVHGVETVIVPFLACGDLSGYDADMCYDRGESGVVLPPVHPPLQAPYLPADSVKEGAKRPRAG